MRGVDTQGITIKTTPGAGASYATIYSDGSTFQDHPEYGNDHNAGFADASGTYRGTWPVAASAPTGRTTVLVSAPNVKTQRLTFTIASGSCP